MSDHQAPLAIEPDPDEVESEAQLCAQLGHGDLERGRARLGFWRSWFLPDVPPRVQTHYALWRAGEGWRRERGRITATLLRGHFEGAYALGGIYADAARVLVQDLDNQTGKRALAEGRVAGSDRDLPVRLQVARLSQPHAVWFRSSDSGGLQGWTFFAEPAPLWVLARLAHERLLRAASTAPEVFRVLRAGSLAGVPGCIELLPWTAPGSQGATIRAPFGPGSALLEPDGRVISADPGSSIQALMDRLSGRLLALQDAFPNDITSQLPLLPDLPTTHFHETLARPSQPTLKDWRLLLLRCDGRRERSQRPDRETYLRVMEWLWANGLPGPSLRHSATFLAALSCRWQGLSYGEALERVTAWLETKARAHSVEWRTRPSAARRKTEGIVAHTYRPEAPTRRRPRYLSPRPIHRGDLVLLEELLPGDGVALDLAVRVLTFARANARVLETGRVICELPMARLGVRTRRARLAFQRLQRAGIFALYACRIPKRDHDHPWGPQRAVAARYTLYWTYSNAGRPLLSRRSVTSRAASQAMTSPSFRSLFATTVRRGVRGAKPLEQALGVEETSAGARPVGAVGARSASKSLVEAVGRVPRLNFEAIHGFHRLGSLHRPQGLCADGRLVEFLGSGGRQRRSRQRRGGAGGRAGPRSP